MPLDLLRLRAVFNLLNLVLWPERDLRSPIPQVLISLDKSVVKIADSSESHRDAVSCNFYAKSKTISVYILASEIHCEVIDQVILSLWRQFLLFIVANHFSFSLPLCYIYFDINVGFDLKGKKNTRHFPDLGFYYKPLHILNGISQGRNVWRIDGSQKFLVSNYHLPLETSANHMMSKWIYYIS